MENFQTQRDLSSQRLTLSTYSAFADIENPIWQTQVRPEYFNTVASQEICLIPVDSFPQVGDKNIGFGPTEVSSNAVYQIWVGQNYLSLNFLAMVLSQGIKVQLWLDQPVIDFANFEALYKELSPHSGFQVVYSPRQLYHVNEIFDTRMKSLLKNVVIHLHTKKNKFDSWPTIDQLWLGLNWMKLNMSNTSMSYQVFDQDIRNEKQYVCDFLLNPTIETYNQFVKMDRSSTHLHFRFARWVMSWTGSAWVESLKLLLIWVRHPSRRNWQNFVGPFRKFWAHLALWRIRVLFLRATGSVWRAKGAIWSALCNFRTYLAVWRIRVLFLRTIGSVWRAKGAIWSALCSFWAYLALWRIRVLFLRIMGMVWSALCNFWAFLALWRVKLIFWKALRLVRAREILNLLIARKEKIRKWVDDKFLQEDQL